MPRARNIKYGFFTNDKLGELDPLARLLFVGLWCLADRAGRLDDRPRKIRAEVLPYDACDVDALLQALHDSSFILRYVDRDRPLIQVVNWSKHQTPHHKEVTSELPAPSGFAQRTTIAYEVSAQTRNSVFERDGGACLRCRASEDLSIDHIVPLSMGGDNSIANLQTLCRRCNSSKGGSTKDYRTSNHAPTLAQAQPNIDATLKQDPPEQVAPCPTDSLIPDSLIPDSLIPDTPLPPKGGVTPKRASAFDPSMIELPESVSRDDWTRWCTDRANRRKPVTAEAARLQVDKLVKYVAGGTSAATVIDHAIENGHQGFFFKPTTQTKAASRHAGFEQLNYSSGVNGDGSLI